MAKVFSFIFSFYILILTLSPCVDKDLSAGLSIGAGTCAHDNTGHQDQNDCCSPFCFCSCCNLPCEIQKTIIDVQDYSVPRYLTFVFTPRFESFCRFSIWEPPKA